MNKSLLTDIPEYHSPFILQLYAMSHSISQWVPWVDTSLSCGPACGAQQLVCTACWSRGHISWHSLPALSPGSRPGSRAAHPVTTERPLLSPRMNQDTFGNRKSYLASVAWDLGRFFSRYFLDIKAIILLSVKSESLNKGRRHLNFLNICLNVWRTRWICSLAS